MNQNYNAVNINLLEKVKNKFYIRYLMKYSPKMHALFLWINLKPSVISIKKDVNLLQMVQFLKEWYK